MMLQSLKPVKQFNHHICSFAIYSHDMSRQIETHHYCSRLNQDFLQCVVYDSDDANACLLGVEYIISDRIFEDLPDEEKKLWHSHAYEMESCNIEDAGGVHGRVRDRNGNGEHGCNEDFDDTCDVGAVDTVSDEDTSDYGNIIGFSNQ
ncbi:oil body-associated protein 2A-like [Arachis hypogaea]|uniref:oil body-associated protein 2A-like n=1 Tax=Arachis hypogaea TaxID=3818 RepID=UPI000DEC04FF|nr:oil body-associated protein 2A-like [Arachis hypogaea]